jgi:single-stranded DNA-binding protein
MSQNQYVLVGAYLVEDPKTRTIEGKKGKQDRHLVSIKVVDNAWDEKRYLPKFVEVTFDQGRFDGEKALKLKKGDQVSVSGRLDVRTYEVDKKGSKTKKETRLAFEIQYPTSLTVHTDIRNRGAEEEGEADENSGTAAEPDGFGSSPAADAPAEGASAEKMPWDE